MPIKRSAYKRIRADKKKRLRNISAKSHIKTAVKKLESLLSSKNKKAVEITEKLRDASSLLDKAAQKGIIPSGTASRKISRLSKKAHAAIKKS